VFFEDCHVPADALVGQEGAAWMQLMAGLNVERLIIAAQSLGLGQRALDDTLHYIKERKQFGRPIGSFQALKHRIADLATDLECCRLLVYAVARQVDENPGALFPREASMAKLKVTETAKKIALEGMQMMGGYGYASEYDMEGHVRTNLVSTIYGGTSEIQREIIAKTHGL
jgi:alkylation response protein AidB-like acyl-CoA dehydrogenase